MKKYLITFDKNGNKHNDLTEYQQSSGGTSDHTQLSNRDKENQHPINAITNLASTINKLNDADAKVNARVDNLNFNGYFGNYIAADYPPHLRIGDNVVIIDKETGDNVKFSPDDIGKIIFLDNNDPTFTRMMCKIHRYGGYERACFIGFQRNNLGEEITTITSTDNSLIVNKQNQTCDLRVDMQHINEELNKKLDIKAIEEYQPSIFEQQEIGYIDNDIELKSSTKTPDGGDLSYSILRIIDKNEQTNDVLASFSSRKNGNDVADAILIKKDGSLLTKKEQVYSTTDNNEFITNNLLKVKKVFELQNQTGTIEIYRMMNIYILVFPNMIIPANGLYIGAIPTNLRAKSDLSAIVPTLESKTANIIIRIDYSNGYISMNPTDDVQKTMNGFQLFYIVDTETQ
jgi:hypothetical protein